ncbi:phosphotransferase [Georgenia deserti]|uniref:Phosphotransferase n=1 Tax=Georgenia deserti TaxID=2093781 RepID=A0ABW4L8H9_9MICO
MREEDRTLAAADPGVPGIATVLDEACLAERLADAGWDVDGARLTYLRYKPGTSLVGGLILRRSDGARIRAFAAAYGEGAPEKLDKSWRAAARHSGVILTDRDAGLVVGDVAVDRDLPGVRSVLTRYPAAQAVAYKPARRWVGIDTGRGRVLKVHRPRAAAAHVAAHRLLAPHLPTAELLATGKDGVVATRFVPGTALETVDRASAQRYRRSVGAVLAAAHRAPVPPGLEPMDLHRTLSGAVGAVEAVAPSLGRPARAVAQQVLLASEDRSARSLVHGDLSADQVVLGADGRPTVIDLDRAGVDDPLTDLASWAAADVVADLLARGVTGEPTPGSLLDGYHAAGGHTDPRALTALTAGALLQRAVEPFRRHLPGWPEHVAALVETAGTLAASAVRDGHGHCGYRPARPRAPRTPEPPDDDRLPGLTPTLALPGARLVSHRTGRRAVVAVDGAAGTEYVKVVRPRRTADVADRLRRLAPLRTVAVPRLLDVDQRAGTLRLTSVGRTTLLEAGRSLGPDTLARTWAGVGRAVSELHALDPTGLPTHDAAAEVAAMTRAVDRAVEAGRIDPDVAGDAVAHAAERLRHLPVAPYLGMLHRDLHDKQVLLDGEGELGLIDVDTLAMGERALDVANLLVHLDLRVRQGLLGARRAAVAQEAFRAALPDEPCLWKRVPDYATATRVRLAGVYAIRPRWQDLATELLVTATADG